MQSSKRDPYSVLGVERTATPAEIKKQYYKAAKEHHPDANPNSPEAAKKFAEATEAYDLLSSEEKRREYDTYGHGGVPGGGGGGGGNPFGGYGMSMDDLFADLFAASLQVRTAADGWGESRGCGAAWISRPVVRARVAPRSATRVRRGRQAAAAAGRSGRRAGGQMDRSGTGSIPHVSARQLVRRRLRAVHVPSEGAQASQQPSRPF